MRECLKVRSRTLSLKSCFRSNHFRAPAQHLRVNQNGSPSNFDLPENGAESTECKVQESHFRDISLPLFANLLVNRGSGVRPSFRTKGLQVICTLNCAGTLPQSVSEMSGRDF
jgi:hypothetical protein